MQSWVEKHNGVPALFINGEPASRHWAYCSPEHARDFTRAGIRILTFPLPRPAEMSRWWVGPDEYDFTSTRALLEEFIRAAPAALFVPRIHFGYAEKVWWPDRFPDECALALRTADGQPDSSFEPRGLKRMQHSMASRVWRDLAGKALAALLQDCEERFGDRVIGYHVGGGHTAEWFPWNVTNEEALDDYSEPMRAAFREHVRRAYGSDEALRRAWHREDVTLETAEIPSPQRRAAPDAGAFYDPLRSRDIVDYQRCYGEETAASAVHLCRVVKENIAGRKITGVFAGYLMTFDKVLCPQRDGHLGFETILESPDVDFVASPYLYENRGWGGSHYAQSLPVSVQARGKLYVDEVDSPPWSEERMGHPFAHVVKPRKPDEWVQTLRRDWAYNAAVGSALWWMDLTDAGWYDDDASGEVLRLLVQADERMGDRLRGSAAEVAVVLDVEAYCAAAPGPSFQEPFIGFAVQWELPRMGAPFDVVLLNDLLEGRVGPYRLLVFPQLAYLTSDRRGRLKEYLEATESSALWLHAPGWLDENGPSADNVRQLTGLGVRIEEHGGHLDAEVSAGEHWLTRGTEPGTAYGSSAGLDERRQRALPWTLDPERIGPRVSIGDDRAVTLASLRDGGEAALAVRETKDRFDVLSTAPAPPALIFRNVAQRAGAHLYAPLGDVVYAGKRFLGILAGSNGVRTITLPAECRVTEAITGAVVLGNGCAFQLDLKAHHCALLVVE
jgi:hypothetical protein